MGCIIVCGKLGMLKDGGIEVGVISLVGGGLFVIVSFKFNIFLGGVVFFNILIGIILGGFVLIIFVVFGLVNKGLFIVLVVLFFIGFDFEDLFLDEKSFLRLEFNNGVGWFKVVKF